MSITRADLESGQIKRLIAQQLEQAGIQGIRVLSEAELQDSIAQTLSHLPANSDVWLFAYGSLVWNPTFHFVDRQVGTIYGLHRRFCLWTQLGRGTPDNPGLMLGLDRGGSCRGVVYRIAAAVVPSELLLVWRREMIFGSYLPRWVKVRNGEHVFPAIAFMINHAHPDYAANLSIDTTVKHLATAEGQLGSAADYLSQTVDGLLSVGIHDHHLLKLRDRVLQLQRSRSESPLHPTHPS